MAAYTIKGRIIEIEAQTREIPYGDGLKFMHRRYLVIDDTRYNPSTGDKMFDNYPCFEFASENCEKLDTFQVGQKVEITFDVRGRKWVNSKTGAERWLNTLSAYKIELADTQQVQAQTQSQPVYAQQPLQQQVQTRPVQTRPQAPTQQAAPQYNQPPYQPPIPGGEIYANQVQDPPLPFQPQPTTRKPVQKQVQEEETDLPF
ncbi:MAG: DUF3127 domain-containing protein [Prevotella sp.]|nr:DUF3127 domain-containing protein [Prevotella sp.]